MYNPRHFAVDDPAETLLAIRAASFGHLVTHGGGNEEPSLDATALPFLVDDDLTTVRAHVARANPHQRSIDGASCLLIVPVTDAYVSPRWYPSKAEHGKVVPTWNYEVVHVRGSVEIHDDTEWVRRVVEDLTDHNEAVVSANDGSPSWRVSDAPPAFVKAQLGAIVGVELHIEGVEAKRKLSQNRAEADRQAVTENLRASNHRHDRSTGDAMAANRTAPTAD